VLSEKSETELDSGPRMKELTAKSFYRDPQHERQTGRTRARAKGARRKMSLPYRSLFVLLSAEIFPMLEQ